MKILAIGNSFADDSFEYFSKIANDFSEEVIIGVLFIGGCSLKMHRYNAENNLSAYEYRKDMGCGFINHKDYSIKKALEYEDWDIVTLQQASHDSGIMSSYDDLDFMIDYVDKNALKKVDFMWIMTWSYEKDSNHPEFKRYGNDQQIMDEKILECVKAKIINNEKICKIIPVGLAIKSARKQALLNGKLSRDGFHLSYDYGRYIAGLVMAQAILKIEIDNIKYRPSIINNDEMLAIVSTINETFNKVNEVLYSNN